MLMQITLDGTQVQTWETLSIPAWSKINSSTKRSQMRERLRSFTMSAEVLKVLWVYVLSDFLQVSWLLIRRVNLPLRSRFIQHASTRPPLTKMAACKSRSSHTKTFWSNYQSSFTTLTFWPPSCTNCQPSYQRKISTFPQVSLISPETHHPTHSTLTWNLWTYPLTLTWREPAICFWTALRLITPSLTTSNTSKDSWLVSKPRLKHGRTSVRRRMPLGLHRNLHLYPRTSGRDSSSFQQNPADWRVCWMHDKLSNTPDKWMASRLASLERCLPSRATSYLNNLEKETYVMQLLVGAIR